MISDRRLYVTEDGSRVVEEGDTDGAFLLVGAGSEIPSAVAEKHKLRISKGKVSFPAPKPGKAEADAVKAEKAAADAVKAEKAAAKAAEKAAAKAAEKAAAKAAEKADASDSQGAEDSATE